MAVQDLEKVWSPRIYFGNGVSIKDLESFGDNYDSLSNFWFFGDKKSLKYSIKFIPTVSCTMNFEAFPFDRHVCELMLINWLGGLWRVKLNSPEIYTYDLEVPKIYFYFTSSG